MVMLRYLSIAAWSCVILLAVSTAGARDAMWVWERATAGALENPAQLEQLIEFCHDNHIDRLYMSAQGVAADGGKQPSLLKPTRYEQWRRVLTRLHEQGITVESLCGKADWLMPTGGFTQGGNELPQKEDRAYGLGIVDDILAYQQAHRDKPNASFDGVHFDIEIETLVGTRNPVTGEPTTPLDRVEYYFQWLDQVTDKRQAAGFSPAQLPFTWDMSMHYDKPDHAGMMFSYAPPTGGPTQTKPAWQHLFDRFERIVFMTYMDRPQLIAEPMRAELAYLDSLSPPRPVRFALEFQARFRSHDLRSIGLSNEDYLTYLNLRRDVSSITVTRPYFKGWALHTYDNINPQNGSLPDWVAVNPPPEDYPSDMTLEPAGEPIKLPTNPQEPITDPVYVQLRLKAHRDYAYTPHSSGNDWISSMLSLLPVGYGYASEQLLERLNATAGGDGETHPNRWYDGLTPQSWWYYDKVAWWLQDKRDSDSLVQHGLCWKNPATNAKPDRGVVRNLVLQAGKPYRITFIYNRPAPNKIVEFVAKQVRVTKPPHNSADQPMVMSLYLGPMSGRGDSQAPQLNSSFVIFDHDGDGVSDAQEFIEGSDPLQTETLSHSPGG